MGKYVDNIGLSYLWTKIKNYVNENAGKISIIKKNGIVLPVDANKSVDIAVPTKISELTNDSGYQDKNGTVAVAGIINEPKNIARNLNDEDYGAIIVGTYTNVLRFLPAKYITIEESLDAGGTWTKMDVTETKIKQLVSGGLNDLGLSFNKTSMVRVTFVPGDRYATIDRLVVQQSTKGGTMKYKVETSTLGAKDTFTILCESGITAGWPAIYNVCHKEIGWGDNTSQTNHAYAYRITFMPQSLGDTATYPTISIYSIMLFGTQTYTRGSMDTHIFDRDRNMTIYGNLQMTEPPSDSNTNIAATTKFVNDKISAIPTREIKINRYEVSDV